MKPYIGWLVAGVSLISQGLITWFSRRNLEWTEQIYSRGIYPVIAQILRLLHRFFPFSLAELILILLCLALIRRLIRLIAQLRGQSLHQWPAVLNGPLSRFCAALGLISLCFQLLWGLNYHRAPLADQLELNTEARQPAVLRELTIQLINEANRLRSSCVEAPNGCYTLRYPLHYYLSEAAGWYQNEALADLALPDLNAPVKPVILSGLMSYTQITGVYFPFTGEANVNINVPDYQLPATICHELAHRYGFAREDEANFLAWLVSTQPERSEEIRYSGTMLALSNCLNAYYRAAPSDYGTLYRLLNRKVQADLAFSRSFWARYEGVVEQASTSINNSYLQSNHQSDGVQSYGRMADLLLAWYLAQK